MRIFIENNLSMYGAQTLNEVRLQEKLIVEGNDGINTSRAFEVFIWYVFFTIDYGWFTSGCAAGACSVSAFEAAVTLGKPLRPDFLIMSGKSMKQ